MLLFSIWIYTQNVFLFASRNSKELITFQSLYFSVIVYSTYSIFQSLYFSVIVFFIFYIYQLLYFSVNILCQYLIHVIDTILNLSYILCVHNSSVAYFSQYIVIWLTCIEVRPILMLFYACYRTRCCLINWYNKHEKRWVSFVVLHGHTVL
jgi:hypothetical protein